MAGQTPVIHPSDVVVTLAGAPAQPSLKQSISDVVEIVVILGEPECARRILDFYCNHGWVRSWVALPAVTVVRLRALLAAVTGDLQGALDLLRTLPARTDRDPAESGRALLMRGVLRMVVGDPGQGTTDLQRAAQLFLSRGMIEWCDASLRALAFASRGTGLRRNDDVATILTGGYWDRREIADGLRRSLLVVEEQLRALGRAPLPAM